MTTALLALDFSVASSDMSNKRKPPHMTKQVWLVKTEPEAYSWETFCKDGSTAWTGVRNYQARIHLKAMKKGDRVFFYHSVTDKAVVGTAEVVRSAFPDPTVPEADGWVAVELKPVKKLKMPVTLEQIKAEPSLSKIALLRQSRLSVMPVTQDEFAAIMKLSGG